MGAIDYSELLDSSAARTSLPWDATLDEDIYERGQGVQFRSDKGRHLWECVHLAEGALLIAAQDPGGEIQTGRQAVNQSDWVHVQFRLNGGGCEDVGDSGVTQTPQGFCIVSRYPENCVVERTLDATKGLKAACLFTTPAALTCLLDTPASGLPERAQWLAEEAHARSCATIVPLQSAMVMAVNDILSCTFQGCSRRTYMRGKSLDLLSMVIHALGASTLRDTPALHLSAVDLERIALARSIMCADLERSLTLSELARKVGINRTKLAFGFKAVHGVSVQAFWRDARLDHALQLLQDGETPVTEAALSVGYSELSSFSHAFTRRFGITPRECRGVGRRRRLRL